MAVLLLLAFFGGALAVVAMELLGLCILIRRLNRKVECEEIKDQATMASPSRGDPNPCLYDKEVMHIYMFTRVCICLDFSPCMIYISCS